ncbi:MAG: Gldg family protein, partial [Myxococcota bacterium]
EKVIYFAQGHGEKAIEGEAADSRDGFKFAAEALRNENYRVEPLLLAQFSEVPEDADAVILAAPERAFLEPELEALDRYLARGGAVFALVEPRVSTGITERLRSWGVELRDDVVVDKALALFGRAITPLAGRYDAEHPITKDLRDPRSDPVIFHEVRSIRPIAGSEMTEVVATGDASWAESDLARLERQGHASLDPGELRGPISVMVAGRPSIDAEDSASPRLVAVGDASFATNELIHNGRNRDLFVNATNWLLGDVRSISIRPNDSRASRFQLTAEQFQTILSTSLFVLPEAIAVLGAFTWWSRRNPPG